MPESARSWVGHVVVGGVRDNVDLAASAAGSTPAEPDGTFGQALPVGSPVCVALPAVVYWVSGEA